MLHDQPVSKVPPLGRGVGVVVRVTHDEVRGRCLFFPDEARGETESGVRRRFAAAGRASDHQRLGGEAFAAGSDLRPEGGPLARLRRRGRGAVWVDYGNGSIEPILMRVT